MEPFLIAKQDPAAGGLEIGFLPRMGNRHGLIAGATGTGKTVSLQTLAENFSRIGVPVFMADVKGDLSGISVSGGANPKVAARIDMLGLKDFQYGASPALLWDVFGEKGHPMRATISEMGPLLLSRILQLNEVQAGVLSIVFKVADANGLLLLDLKDLRSMLKYVADNAKDIMTEYGNVSAASVGSIQRGLLTLEEQGGDKLFGEPALDLNDLMQTDRGRGVINILAADKLMASPQMYATFLLWLLSELFETLPEVGDLDKPKLVFFFDEAHLLFDDAPQALLQKIEQVVRLIRSKGVGVYFISQNPLDVPDVVLGQMGNRIQHALRAFTPRDQKAVKAAATTFRVNPKINVEEAIQQLGVGEALVSFLDEKGIPGIVQRAFVLPPRGQIGPITPEQRQKLIQGSILYGHYEHGVDRESAYEVLTDKAKQDAALKQSTADEKRAALEAQLAEKQRLQNEKLAAQAAAAQARAQAAQQRAAQAQRSELDKFVGSVGKSVVRSVATTAGREILRGVLGGILGGGSKRRY
jgi:DNA helicase HerA-like ATPase